MKFLFGDSTAFPHPFNFLSTLGTFMSSATKVVELELDVRRLATEAAEAEASRERGLAAAQALSQRLSQALAKATGDLEHPIAREYAAELAQDAADLLEQKRAGAAALREREQALVASESKSKDERVRAEVEALFLKARLPFVSWRIAGELREARYVLVSSLQNPGQIRSDFELDVAKLAAWNAPRKVGELAPELELNVGVKKAFFKGTVSFEPLRLDDLFVGHFDASEDAFELALRKKPDHKDSLVFRVHRTENGLAGKVSHPLDPNAQGLPPELSAKDLQSVDRVWKKLRSDTVDLLDRREKVRTVAIEGRDVFKEDVAFVLVKRLVDVLAPTVREIARRSPNENELSLKAESDDGRREEIYLRRDELLSKLQPLSATGRELFVPLGLDTWVPAASMRPPAVTIPVVDAVTDAPTVIRR